MAVWLLLAGLNGAMAVALDAYVWHAAGGDQFARTMAGFAIDYQMIHALALIGVAWLAHLRPGGLATAAGVLFVAGLIGFSGTLYMLGLAGYVPVEGAAPVGGGLLILGWLCLGLAGFGRRRIIGQAFSNNKS